MTYNDEEISNSYNHVYVFRFWFKYKANLSSSMILASFYALGPNERKGEKVPQMNIYRRVLKVDSLSL